jgi:amino acid transporter
MANVFCRSGITMSLNNGGPAGGIWMFLVVVFGMTFVMLSFAEMASMAPTCGGQYHWVSELAPRKHQKFLSYVVGMPVLLYIQLCSTDRFFQDGYVSSDGKSVWLVRPLR